MTRRELLSRLAAGTGLAAAGIVGIPALGNVLSPIFDREDGEQWQPLGPVDDFPVGEMSKATFTPPQSRETSDSVGEKMVYVWRESPENIVVFSQRCTDLGCGLIWDPGSEWFFCPCHGGIFSKDGERQAGPPQRPMYRYETRRQDGELEIDLNSLPPMT